MAPPDPASEGAGRHPGRVPLALTAKLAAFLVAALVGPVAVYSASTQRGPVETVLLGLWFVLVVTAGVALFVWRPLKQLTVEIDRFLETGELRHDLFAPGRDDVGQLVEKFRRSVGRLQGLPRSARDSIRELGVAVGGLNDQLQRLAAALQAQAGRLADTRATLQDLRRTATWARGQAESVLEVVARGEDLGLSGRSAVEQGLQGLQQIRSQVEGVVAQIALLGRQTGRVGGILETVKEVADQSHFLAVNATIEAARAGELGKGFTVVAREVRMLADQSLRSTGQMQDLLDELREAIGLAVRQSEGGHALIEEGVDRVRISGERMNALATAIEQTGQATRQIAASFGQQSEGVGRLATDLDQLDRTMVDVTAELAGIQKLAERLRSSSLGLSDLMARLGR